MAVRLLNYRGVESIVPPSPANIFQEQAATTRRAEFIVFFILAVMIWPFVAVSVVGGYGFLVWIIQMMFGPPGPPA